MSVNVSGLVDATPEAAFAVVSDPEQDPLWRESVKWVELSSGEARTVGASYAAHVEVMGRQIGAELRLDSLDPPRQVGYSLTTPVRASATYTVEAEGTGARVTFELNIASSGGVAAMRERVVAGFIAQGAERDLRSLGQLLAGRRADQ